MAKKPPPFGKGDKDDKDGKKGGKLKKTAAAHHGSGHKKGK